MDEVRRSAGIVRIVSDHVALKRAGKSWKGLCPFHREKTPSFTVDEEKGLYFCFGCGTGGDVFRFLMQVEALTFPQAIRAAAERCGVPLPRETGPGSSDDPEREALFEANARAMKHYRERLWGREGEPARKYLRARGISDETANRFEMGFAPARWDGLLSVLGRDPGAETLEKAGLVLRRQDGRGYYDRFRGRLIFPIIDLGGRTVGFGGRVFEGAAPPDARGDREEPKYLNSPETPVYRKGSLLYGLHAARRAVRDQGAAILVEGYMDVIALHQHGYPSAVGVLGTAFTTEQARLLARFARKAFVNFDADESGAKAADRSLDLLLAEGFEVRVVRLPKGEDPDSLLRARGPEAYREALRGSRHFLDDLLEEAVGRADLREPAGRVGALNAILPFLAKVEDRVFRSQYASRLAERLGIEDAVILDALKRTLYAGAERLDLPDGPGPLSGPGPDERMLLHALVEDPASREEILREIETGMLSPASQVVVNALRRAGGGRVDPAALAASIEDEGARRLLARLATERLPEGGEGQSARSILRKLRGRREEKRKADLTRKMEAAQRAGDREALARLAKEKMDLLRGKGGEGA